MAKEFHADSSNQRDKEKFRVAKEPLYSVSKYLLFFFFFWMFLPLLCSFSWTPIWAPYTYTTWWQGMGFIFVWTEKEEWIHTIGSTSMFPNTYPDLSSFRLCRSSYLTERNMVLLVRNDILERWGFSLIVHDITSCSIFIGKGM
jgi:hypothetical protein